MRIVVDRDRCEGLGMCEAMARPEGHAAVEACPVPALSLVD